MKKARLLLVILLMLPSLYGLAQNTFFGKITPDLWNDISGSQRTDEMFQTIIIMEEQLDSQQTLRHIQFMDKDQKRDCVVSELQKVSKNGQKELLNELQQGQKAAMVDKIQSFWIINAISCRMTKDMLLSIASRPDVKFIAKDTEIFIADGETHGENPFDRGDNQWNVTKVNADDVWELGYTGAGIIVAVIDSGVNYNHTDIANNMWDGGPEFPNHGWDFVNNDNDPMDDNGHGTHCAGTVSSYGTNGKQCGIAKDAKIMALKVLGADGSGSKANSWTAIEFAVSHGADILSMSLGANGIGGIWEERVVMEHVLQCGVVASVAAGNVGNIYQNGELKYPVPYNIGAPGNCPSPWHNPDQILDGGLAAVVCVGATNSNDEHSAFSSIGPVSWSVGEGVAFYNDYPWESGSSTNTGLIKPDISAPGYRIVSLNYANDTGYTTLDGTSMATPCVAGVMALMLSVNPTLTPKEIDSIIETTAIPLEGQTAKNNTVGAGRIDALAAITHMLNACEAPTSLTAEVSHANVSLNWSAASDVSFYSIYRNGLMIADDITGTSYIDSNVPAGSNIYYVRSNGSNHQASIPSNLVTVDITTNTLANVPEHLAIVNVDTTDNTVLLTWDAPETRHDTLRFPINGSDFLDFGGELIAAQKFPPQMLQAFAGMEITNVVFSVLRSDSTYTINLYEGDALLPGNLLYSGSSTSTEEEQTITHNLENPIVINPNHDLWLTITTTDGLAFDPNYYSNEANNAFLYRYATTNYWTSLPGMAWDFQLGLSDGAFTYNVYCNNATVSVSQDTTSYNGSLPENLNTYQITAITNGYESSCSNTVHLAKNTTILTDLSLELDEQFVAAPGSTVTVSGTITNSNPANIVIEDGAQLIHHNSPVQATLKKSIDGFGYDNSVPTGWYTIASPVDGFSVSSLTEGEYDLYAYDEESVSWFNQKNSVHNITAFEEGLGLLYANALEKDIAFAGNMKATSAEVSVPMSCQSSNANLKGFNLAGNPFSCNLSTGDINLGGTTLTTYYVVEGGSQLEVRTLAETPIKPGQGFLVQATAAGQELVFHPTGSKDQTEVKPSYLCIKVGGDNFTDRAFIQFGEGNTLKKMVLHDGTIELSLQYDNADYASIRLDSPVGELPLLFKAAKSGTYTLTVSTPLNYQLSMLHLIDNLTGADIDLLATPSYSFEAKTNDIESRFKLVFDENKNQENHH